MREGSNDRHTHTHRHTHIDTATDIGTDIDTATDIDTNTDIDTDRHTWCTPWLSCPMSEGSNNSSGACILSAPT